MPKVSVVIPNYNHARFLPQRIESVLAQTFTDFDVLLLDDASTDDSMSIISRYQNLPRVRIVANAANGGSPFKQWNKGLQEVRGDFLWIAESDDYADPDFLSVLVPLLESNSNCALAYCASRYVDENGALGGMTPGDSKSFDESRWKSGFVANGKEESRTHLFFRSTIPNASAVLVRRSALIAAGGADESMQLCGDWFTWVKVLQEHDLAYTPRVLNYFRVPHVGSQRRAAQRERLPLDEWLRVVTFIKERLQPDAKTELQAKRYLAQMLLEFGWRSLHAGRGMGAFLEGYSRLRRFDKAVFYRLLEVLAIQTAKRARLVGPR